MQHQSTAIVTGGSRGIGRGIAEALGGLGMNVVINYHSNAAAADEAAAAVRSARGGAGGEVLTVQADVGRAEDRERLVDATLERFGDVHALVNNAGVAPKVRADLLETPEESYDFVVDTNLKGPFFLTQRVAREMVARGGDVAGGGGPDASSRTPQRRRVEGEGGEGAGESRCIVNVNSISAYTASVNRGEYCVSKAGLAMVTKLFAARLAEHGINVYEVRPGVIETDMTGAVKEKYDRLIFDEGLTPIRRWGQPADVAAAVAAMVEGRLPFSTGEVINVDGGFHLRRL